MFNLFNGRSGSRTEIVRDGGSLAKRLGMFAEARRKHFDAQGDDHADIDFRLVEKINRILVPALGPETTDTNSRWYHEMDFYGDGIRHLEFNDGEFRQEFITELQALLQGEHEQFGILCWTEDGSLEDGSDAQGVLIYSDMLILTKGLAQCWSIV